MQSEARTEAMDVALFDFYSHSNMHLPFNEGYARVVRAAFPRDRITLHADGAHLRNLEPRLAGLDVRLQPLAPFAIPFGLSHHNPVGARLAAVPCFRAMRDRIHGPVRFAALLGFDAGLYATVSRRWDVADGPLHLLIHGALAANYVWRSRNPFVRAGDLRSTLARRRLRPGIHLVGLELGVPEAVVAEFPALAPSIGVLEHPVLETEWSETPSSGSDPVSVGFLGFGSVRKGFDVFANLARDLAGGTGDAAVAFDAVGHADTIPGLRTDGLRRQLAPRSLSRQEYLDGLRSLDLVCLPLHGRSYDFAASGTVSDAIAALKPVLALRTRTLQAIEDRYGPFGRLFDSVAEMGAFLGGLRRSTFARDSTAWIHSLRRIRDARRPETLGQTYRP